MKKCLVVVTVFFGGYSGAFAESALNQLYSSIPGNLTTPIAVAAPVPETSASVVHGAKTSSVMLSINSKAAKSYNSAAGAGLTDTLKREWKHINLMADEGTKISIDYVTVNSGSSVMAAPVWVNISGHSLEGDGRRLKVVLINYYEDLPGDVRGEMRDIELLYAGDNRYTAKIEKWDIYLHGYFGYRFRQEIAIQMDGRWLKDPVSGTNNFKFKMR